MKLFHSSKIQLSATSIADTVNPISSRLFFYFSHHACYVFFKLNILNSKQIYNITRASSPSTVELQPCSHLWHCVTRAGAGLHVGSSTGCEQLPYCKLSHSRTPWHCCHLLPGATLLPSSAPQGMDSALWLLAIGRFRLLARKERFDSY